MCAHQPIRRTLTSWYYQFNSLKKYSRRRRQSALSKCVVFKTFFPDIGDLRHFDSSIQCTGWRGLCFWFVNYLCLKVVAEKVRHLSHGCFVFTQGQCYPTTGVRKHSFDLWVHRSLEWMHGVALPLSADTVHFPLGQWAHSRHAQSERENNCALFPLVILDLLSALSVLILQSSLCWSALFI